MWVGGVSLFIVVGCTDDLLPGELVIPGELRATITSSTDILGFGSDVAVDEHGDQVVAAAVDSGWAGWPGGDHVLIPNATSMNVWFDSGRATLGAGDFGVLDIESGELLHEIEGVRTIRGYDGGWIAALPDRVIHSNGVEWLLSDPRVVDASETLRVAISCEIGECSAFQLLDEGTVVLLGEAGDGGDIWIDGETIWWGSPSLNIDGDPGRVNNSIGEEVTGLEGDHIGRSIGGGYTTGGLNWHLSPRRVIVHSLDGGQSVTLDGMSGPGSIALGGSETLLVLGVSGWAINGSVGAVIAVDRDNIY